MSLSQFEFWNMLEAKIIEARRDVQTRIDSGAASNEVLRQMIGERRAYQHVRLMAREVYATMTGTPTEAAPPPEDEDDFPV